MLGRMAYELRGPDGRIKARGVTHNLVTGNGDQYCAKKLYSAPTLMTAMKLGTATTAPAKTGAGSFVAVADYVSGSAHACDESSPKAGGTNDIVTFIHTWAAGEATNSTINRVAIVDNTTDAGEADATHTLSAALMNPAPVAKGAADTLKITWNITFLGA
jgi:hypothetical protein